MKVAVPHSPPCWIRSPSILVGILYAVFDFLSDTALVSKPLFPFIASADQPNRPTVTPTAQENMVATAESSSLKLSLTPAYFDPFPNPKPSYAS